MRGMWDVFCRVIDNHGDLGVCVRLARQLAQRGIQVRLWVDDARALTWMAPDLAQGTDAGVRVLDWSAASDPQVLSATPIGRVWIEAFGCELPQAWVQHAVQRVQQGQAPAPRWINLEYLSAEDFVPRHHGLPSPVMSGPAQGWTKHFFYPGFTPGTGGLLREADLWAQQAQFDRHAHRLALCPDAAPSARLVSLFCYEPPGLVPGLAQLAPNDRVLVTPGRAWAALQQAAPDAPHGQPLAYQDQAGFDRLLWACDLNFVRGEDSLVRALWAGQPLVWQIYPQDDGAHQAKLEAFLDWLQAPASLRNFHQIWNGLATGSPPALTPSVLTDWGACIAQARQRLAAQADLVTQLLDFVAS